MQFSPLLLLALVAFTAATTLGGIIGLVQRRIPQHVNDFTFRLTEDIGPPTDNSTLQNDKYGVSSTSNNSILIEGNSIIALASGLHRYLTDVLHVDIYWYIGSRLDVAPATLPGLSSPINGSSIVPWRYHFNTATFSYTAAFWTWEDWELELDWMALRGINLPLAWVGFEKILVDTFLDINMTEAEITSFLSGPAFQAWNRLGNIQGSWRGDLPTEWIESQSALQKKIVARMVELGMTPVLPAFTGFVPRAISRVRPNAQIVKGSDWSDFPIEYSNVTFLEPVDPVFTELQTSFIRKQKTAYGNVTNIYTLDQYNENSPFSGDLDYLKKVSYNTWQSLKEADSESVWLMQGWLFYSDSTFWTNDRVEAYLGGVETDEDLLILDLFSESQPQWQRTNSYYGKPWVWCQLHDYGGNMGLYGQVENITINPIEALVNSSSLVGFGLTMEGQEGNEIMYDLLMDQAWSASPIETATYFHNWVSRRYNGNNSIPSELYKAWDIMHSSVYNNTNLTSSTAVTKSIYELSPNITGMLGRTGHHATTINYDPALLVEAWTLMYNASKSDSLLWNNPAYQYDLVDLSRQVYSNNFSSVYANLITTYQSPTSSNLSVNTTGTELISLLTTLDKILLTNPSFSLSTWLSAATVQASSHTNYSQENTSTVSTFYQYNARNQITLWGPTGQINDYASKSWGGLISSYYIPRWNIFLQYLNAIGIEDYNTTALNDSLEEFELGWQTEIGGVVKSTVVHGTVAGLRGVLEESVFGY